MVETVLAALGLAACVALLLWMTLGERRQAALRQAARGVLRWRSRRRQAREEAARAIERARRAVERDGNVFRPRSFKGPPPGDRSDD
jgi:hypothetical protein